MSSLLERAQATGREIILPYHIPKGHLWFPEGSMPQSDTILPHKDDDEWLLQNDAGFETVYANLRGRVRGIQLALEQSELGKNEYPFLMRDSYGIEGPLSTHQAKFLAYVFVFDEFSIQQEHNTSSALALQKEADLEYEAEKARIKSLGKSKGNYAKMISEAHRTIYARFYEKAEPHTRLAAQAEAMSGFLLETATIEYLSAQSDDQLSIVHLPHAVSGLLEMQTDEESRFSKLLPAGKFLASLADHLITTKSPREFAHVNYKLSEGLSADLKDCEALDTILTMALDTQHYTVSPEVSQQLKNFGAGALGFFRNRAHYFASVLKSTDQPYLTLMYDLLNSIFSGGKPDVVKKIPVLFDQLFTDIDLKTARQEGEIIFQKYTKSINQFLEEAQKLVLQLKPHSTDQQIAIFLDHFLQSSLNNQQWKNSVYLSDGGRLNQAFNIIGLLAGRGKTSHFIARSKILSTLGQDFYDANLALYKKQDPLIKPSLLFAVMRPRQPLGITADVGSSLYLDSLVRHALDRNFTDAAPLSTQKDDLEASIKNLEAVSDPAIRNSLILNRYGTVYWPKEEVVPKTEENEDENAFLWRRIDLGKWFISPRGDRFPAQKDEGLEPKGIESITFRVNREFPREHLVELKLLAGGEPIQLWIDTQGRMLNVDHGVLTLDTSFRQAIQNLIFRRLFVIASGILSKEQKSKPKEYEYQGGRYQRAHYDYLTDPRYHMESAQARRHAKELKQDYNIDLKIEEDRRKKAGDMRSHWKLTYSREGTPDRLERNVLPNILTYDDELVVIPLSERGKFASPEDLLK